VYAYGPRILSAHFQKTTGLLTCRNGGLKDLPTGDFNYLIRALTEAKGLPKRTGGMQPEVFFLPGRKQKW
jgi:hypothetical protein